MAERGDHGRDYLLREDSPFLSPLELIGGIILIVCGYWLLRGLLSIPDYVKQAFSPKNIKQTTTTNRRREKSYYELTAEELIKKYDKAPTIELAKQINSLYSLDKNEFEAQYWAYKEEDLKLEKQIQELNRKYQETPSSSLAIEIANNYRRKYSYSYKSMNYSERSTIESWEKKAKEMKVKESIDSQIKQFDKSPSSKLAMEIRDNYQKLCDYQNIKIWEKKAKEEKEVEEKKEREKKRKEMENEIVKLEPIFEENPDSDIASKLLNLYLKTHSLKGILYFYKTRERHSLPPILEDIEKVIPDDYFPYNLKKIIRREKYNNAEREVKMFEDLKELAPLKLCYKNHIQVMTNLAFCYACGIGTEKNLQKAIQIIEELRDYKIKQLSNDEVHGQNMTYYPQNYPQVKTVTVGLHSVFKFNHSFLDQYNN